MDERDFGVLRWLSPDGVARFWGSRRVLDPRITARQIARHVGISETSVRARLRSLADRGLLIGHEVWPNPSIFGVREVFAEVRVRATRDVARLFEEAGWVEGVVLARDYLDLEARKVQIYYVADSAADLERRTALLRRLAKPEPLVGPFPVFLPGAPTDLGPLDWRVLAAMRDRPELGVAGLARELGVSLRTVARRYHHLLDSGACWYAPGPDTEDGPWAFVEIGCASATDRASVAERLPRMFTCWMPLSADSSRPGASGEGRRISGLLLMESLAHLERGIREIEALPGVQEAYRGFALGTRTYPTWFRQQIAARLGSTPPGPGRRSVLTTGPLRRRRARRPRRARKVRARGSG